MPLVLDPSSGLVSLAATNAYDLFFTWINTQRGGIYVNGTWHSLVAVAADTTATPDGAEIAMRYMLEDGIRLFLGPDRPGVAQRVGEVADASAAVVLHPMAFESRDFIGLPYVYGLSSTLASWGQVNGKLLYEMGIRKVAFISQDLGSISLCEAVVEELVAVGIEVVARGHIKEPNLWFGYFDKATQDYWIDVGLNNISNATATVDAVVDCVDSCGVYFNALRRRAITAKFFFSTYCMVKYFIPENFLDQLDDESTAYWIAGVTARAAGGDDYYTAIDATWTRERFQTIYTQTFQQVPSLEAVSAWAAAGLMVEAIEKANSTDPELVRAVFSGLDTTTIFGRARFVDSPNGQNTEDLFSPVQFKLVQSGQSFVPEQVHICYNSTSDCTGPEVFEPTYPWPAWDVRWCHQVLPQSSVYGYMPDEEECVHCPGQLVSSFHFETQRRICQECEVPALGPGVTRPPVVALFTDIGGMDWQSNLTAADDTGPCFPCQLSVPERQCFYSCEPGRVPTMSLERAQNQNLEPSSLCRPCAAGRMQVSGQCIDCPPGRTAVNSGETTCAECARGSISSTERATGCDDCPAGFFVSSEGFTECQVCPPGRFTNASGESICNVCEVGRAVATIGNTRCNLCLPGSFSDWSGKKCSPCEAGKFNPLVEQGSCVTAPAGASAPIPGLQVPWNGEGYYISTAFSIYEAILMINLNNVPIEDVVSLSFCEFQPAACLLGETCLEGHVGVQCLACRPGYTRNTGTCFKCHSKVLDIITTIFSFTVGLTFTFFLGSQFLAAAGSFAALHPIILKQIFNFLLMMSVATQFHDGNLRASSGLEGNTDLDNTLLTIAREITAFTDWGEGFLPSETPVYSVACMLQPILNAEEEALVDILASLNMTQYTLTQQNKAKEVLVDYLSRTESRRMLFWTVLPGMLMVAILIIGYYMVFRALRRNTAHFSQSLQFYTVVYRNTLEMLKTTAQGDHEKKVEDKYQLIQAYPTKLWTSYVKQYYYRIWGIWSPVSHSRMYLRWGFLNIVRLKQETSTVLATAYFIAYGSVLVGISRSFHCVEVSGEWRLLYQSEVKCDFTVEWYQALGFLFFFMWGLLPLVWMISLLRSHKKLLFTDERVQRRFGFLTNGYKSNFCYWELVIFFRKFLLCLMRVFHGSGTNLFLMLGVTSLVAQLSWQPYDPRADNILNTLESMQLVIWMIIASAIKASERTDSGAMYLAVSFIILVLHYGYFCVACLHLFRHMRQWVVKGLDVKQVQNWKPSSVFGSLWQRLQMRAIHREQVHLELTPYVSYDLKYGWVTVVGTRADEATPTYVPKGADAVKEFEANDGKPFLSQAPAKPKQPNSRKETRPKRASAAHTYRLQDILSETICFLAAGQESKGAMSGSLLDFALRAAFVVERTADAEAGQAYAEEEQDEQWMKSARQARDPLYRAEGDTSQVDDWEDDDAAETIEINHCKRLLNSIREELTVKESEFADTLIANRKPGEGEQATMQLEERYAEMVKHMFSPATFRRGIPLDHIQSALLLLQRKPREHLEIWMNLFEKEWVIERVNNEASLIRMASGFVPAAVQCPHEDSTAEEMRRLALAGEEDVALRVKGRPKEVDIQTDPLRTAEVEEWQKAMQSEEELHARIWVSMAVRLVDKLNPFKLWSLRPAVARMHAMVVDTATVHLERAQQRRAYLQAARQAAESERETLQEAIADVTQTLEVRTRDTRRRDATLKGSASGYSSNSSRKPTMQGRP